ncbi:glycosyltransferase family 4 protein [Candidatus Peribacteria bacterium]|nr:glycosyltransferase family 4 protein [Candidatus Peribacteria bacterium]
MIRIGIDARMYSDAFTGIGRVNHEIITRLVERHTDVTWVLFMNQPQYSQYSFPPQVEKVLADTPYYSVAEQTRFLAQLYRERLDLMHFTNFNMPLGYMRPFVVTIHDLIITLFQKSTTRSPLLSWLQYLAYSGVIARAAYGSRQIITVSESTKRDILSQYRVREEKIRVIYNAVGAEFTPAPLAEQTRIRERYDLPGRFLLYVGNWSQHKNVPRLLRAFAKLRSHPDYHDVQLVITGTPNPRYPEVPDTIAQLQLQEQVRTVGHVPLTDLVALYTAATVHVHPSLYEGFGIMPLEALACGTPTLVSHTSSLPEVCEDSALYCDPTSTLDIAQQLQRLLSDTALQNTLVAKGQERLQHFSWDVSAEQVWQVYQEAL